MSKNTTCWPWRSSAGPQNEDWAIRFFGACGSPSLFRFSGIDLALEAEPHCGAFKMPTTFSSASHCMSNLQVPHRQLGRRCGYAVTSSSRHDPSLSAERSILFCNKDASHACILLHQLHLEQRPT